VTGLTDSDANNTLTYGRNSIGQLYSIKASYVGSGGDNVPSYILGTGNGVSYNALGEPTSYADAGSIVHTLTYDTMGRLTAHTTALGPYQISSIQYNADGNVKHIADNAANGTWDYTYDSAMGRITGATCTAACPNGWGTVSWTYDEFGNRWTQSASLGPNTSYSFDTHNHIQGLSYDLAGNLVYDGFNSYAFDALNRLTGIATQFEYTYDGLGNRVEATPYTGGSLDFIFDGSRIIHTNNSTQFGKSMNLEPLGLYNGVPGSGGMTFWVHYRDQVGTLREESKFDVTAGQIPKVNFTSLPFGDALTLVGTGDTNSYSDSQFFGNMFYDTKAGQGIMYNTPAREASTIQGRWLSVDPLHSGWNGYVYANNNPVSANDPSGLCPPTNADTSDCNGNDNNSPAVNGEGSTLGGEPTNANAFPPINPISLTPVYNDPQGGGGSQWFNGPWGYPHGPWSLGDPFGMPVGNILAALPESEGFEELQFEQQITIQYANSQMFWGSAGGATANFGGNSGTGSRLPNGDVPLNPYAQAVFSQPVIQNSIGAVNFLGMTLANTMAPWAVTATNCLSGSCSASGVALAAVPLGLGTTGRVAATSLKEALAMEEVMASPGGVELTNVIMSDARWPASQGWVKMQQIVNGINIHYLKNRILGVFDDFKFIP